MSKGTILVVGSNADLIGQFLNETAVPIKALVAAGYVNFKSEQCNQTTRVTCQI